MAARYNRLQGSQGDLFFSFSHHLVPQRPCIFIITAWFRTYLLCRAFFAVFFVIVVKFDVVTQFHFASIVTRFLHVPALLPHLACLYFGGPCLRQHSFWETRRCTMSEQNMVQRQWWETERVTRVRGPETSDRTICGGKRDKEVK